ncbi:16S rRNA (guanine(966)-N(2))-methyltransferase RsmD [Candidatus Tisiphia endosymbiont of Nemotelus uliginosus]|uniref:16S rRNA (guanine(966)-N(2))-methyltransferase RsmD n=1 Tax=Candidatus Tisiphia endosymbiont of Nemotelus uliginosus TaxID=3077926 RepID=UPI0035C8D984
MIRIIAGKHKNRLIPTLKHSNYRPSTAKIREAIFSILTSGELACRGLFTGNAMVLDLFSGTGSLSFEALSRGAWHVTLVDINAHYLRTAKEFAVLIDAVANTTFLNINACILPKATKAFDLVFVDPPYYNNLVIKSVNSLKKGGWLKDGSILVIEFGKTEIFTDNCFKLIKEKIYGDSKLLVLEYRG